MSGQDRVADQVDAMGALGNSVAPDHIYALALGRMVEEWGRRGKVGKRIWTSRMGDQPAAGGRPRVATSVGTNQAVDRISQVVLIAVVESGGITMRSSFRKAMAF